MSDQDLHVVGAGARPGVRVSGRPVSSEQARRATIGADVNTPISGADMNDTLAVAGGTGLIGRMVVDAARAAGREPVVLARSTGVDLLTGAGLDQPCAASKR